ncbi:hypothetical protein D6C95_08708, partial [Aureobasidium pullulans]
QKFQHNEDLINYRAGLAQRCRYGSSHPDQLANEFRPISHDNEDDEEHNDKAWTPYPVMTIIGTDSEERRTTSVAVDVAPTSTSIGRGIPVVPVHHADEKEKEVDIGSAIPYVPIHHEDDGGLAFPVVPVDHHTTRTTTGTSHLPKASAFHKRSGQ